MKVLTLKIGGTTHAAGMITAGLSREALKIQTDVMELGRKGVELQENPDNLDAASELLNEMLSLRDRKSWFICKVYGDTFTLDELEDELTDQQIDAEINKIIAGVAGIVTKN